MKNKIFNTDELEKFVKSELNKSKYGKELLSNLQEFYIFTNDFQITNHKFGPFVIVYSNDTGYHKTGIGDRGEIHEDDKIYTLLDLCFSIFWDISFRLSTPPVYTVNNYSGDWRRWSFGKRLEILSSIDEVYYQMGKKKVAEILVRNPYNDEL